MNSNGQSRRDLLKRGAALAGLAAAGLGSVGVPSAKADTASYKGERADTGAAGDYSGYWDPSLGANQPEVWVNGVPDHNGRGGTPVEDLVGVMTPAHSHFTTWHRDPIPNVDAHKHTVLIHGMVDRPLLLTMEDIKRLPSVSRVHYVACAANGGGIGQDTRIRHDRKASGICGFMACSEWTGVPLSVVLEMAGVQKGASWMVAEGTGAKKHAADVPLAKALSDESPAFLAYGQNGETVRPEQGYPLRLITPGFEGMRNVKGLQRIKITDRPYWTYYENVAYNNLKTDGKARNFQYEMEPSSIITFPSGEQKLPGPGFYEIRGLAWSGGGSVHRVEVSTDGGKTWKDAELQLPIHRIAFTSFRMPWKWDGQETVITSRCTDDNGDIQPSLPEFSKIWNVPPDYWQKSNNRVQHFNAWVPWKINSDGRVKDFMWDPSNNVAG